MAKVRVTKVNFTSLLKDEDSDFASEMLLKAFTGKDVKELIKNIPEEEGVWIDTDKVCAVSSLVKIKENGQVVFSIMFAPPVDGNDCKIWVKGEQYEDFIKIWAGKQEWLDEGVYKVGLNIPSVPGTITVQPEMWAEVSEDGKTVTVRRMQYV